MDAVVSITSSAKETPSRLLTPVNNFAGIDGSYVAAGCDG